jgi:hypothetical protein
MAHALRVIGANTTLRTVWQITPIDPQGSPECGIDDSLAGQSGCRPSASSICSSGALDHDGAWSAATLGTETGVRVCDSLWDQGGDGQSAS